MAENLFVPSTQNKEEIYQALIPQIEALISGERDLIANLANISAVLNEAFRFFWVGFYLVKENELVLGPFQGPLACTRIRYGKGVCGAAWKSGKTIVVPDVNQFPGHIACSSLSQSEIVLPILSNHKVVGVLDIDNEKTDSFDDIDKKYLEELCNLISVVHFYKQ